MPRNSDSKPRKSRIDAWFARLGETLSDPDSRRAFIAGLPRVVKKFLTIIFTLYVVFSVVALGLTEWIGERNIFFAFLLYLPTTIWVLPLAFLIPLTLLIGHWRLALVATGWVVAFVWLYMDWESSGPHPAKGGRTLAVLTFNRGQRAGSLRPFKNEQAPDVLAFQEATRKSSSYLRAEGYEEFEHGADIGEFAVVAKHPIIEEQLISHDGTVIAGRFVLEFEGAPIALYNVHLQTPRDQLGAYKRGAFLWGLLGIPGTPMSTKRERYQAFWDRQIASADKLVSALESEALPFLVVGDFNMPAHGYLYRKFSGRYQDAHETAGHGFGYTFPGKTRNPLMLFGPWLRIDHQFASDHWRVLDCVTETDRASQHLAVAARYELVGSAE